MKEVLEKIQKQFDFLFLDGFEIAESVLSSGFGNWIVYLRSKKFIAMIVQDRAEISVRLTSPRTRGRKLADLIFFDAETVIGYLSRNIHYAFFQESQQDVNIQLARIASELKSHYEKVCSFFEKSDDRLIKEDFELFREKVREYYLGPYGYKSRNK
jgi:ASC-1-like (ASCH) protein